MKNAKRNVTPDGIREHPASSLAAIQGRAKFIALAMCLVCGPMLAHAAMIPIPNGNFEASGNEGWVGGGGGYQWKCTNCFGPLVGFL